MKNELTQEIVQNLLDYNPQTGKMFWRHRNQDLFSSFRQYRAWNSRYEGKEAGNTSKTANNYYRKRVAIKHGDIGKIYLFHRIVWLHYYGCFPEAVIDHLNRDATDNRIENLRLSSISLNCWNKSVHSNNTSGIVGVHFYTRTSQWIAAVSNKKIGYFDDKYEAGKAVAKYRKENGMPMHNHYWLLDY